MRKRKSSAAPTVESSAIESPAETGGEGAARAEPPEDESPAVAADDATGSYASDDVADAPLEGGDGGEEDTSAKDLAGPPGEEGVTASAGATAGEVTAETSSER